MAFKIVNHPIVPAVSEDPKPAAKHFDIVLGLDFHVLKVPWPITPCPITPFAALVFDPMDYIHFTVPAMPVYTDDGFTIARDVPLGGTVLINDCYRGAAQSALWGMPSVPPLMGKLKGLGKAVKALNLLHSVIPHPLFLLPKFFHPHEGQLSHGSKTVITQGMYQSTFLCRAYSCQDVGKILLNNPTGGFYLNFLTAVMVVLPLGKPVLIGGPKVEQELKLADLINALMLMGLTHGLKFAVKMLGKLLTKLMAKIEAKFPGFKKFRSAVQPFVCKYLGEPVDAASGHMASYLDGFTLPGPIPLVWEANYYSDSNYDGPLGKNIYHSYDITLMVDDADSMVIMNDTAGRPVVFPVLQPGTSFYNPMEKYELHRDEKGEYFVSHKDGLYYYFNGPLQGSNGHGNLRSIVNRNGFAIRFTYNHKGQLIQIKDSADRLITVESNEEGLISALKLPNPALGNSGVSFDAVRYTYTKEGNLNGLYNAEGYLNRFAWKERYIIARRFNDGTVFTFEYDKVGRCTAALGPDGLFSYTFVYLEGHTIATNSLGHSKDYYHQGGIVTKIVNSLGGEQLFTYDDCFNLIAESNELGIATTYAYDDKGNVISVNLPGQGEVLIKYNEQNKPIETVLPNGGVWQYRYDDNGNILHRINPLGSVTKYTYNNGLIRTITNAIGQNTEVRHDSQYNLQRVELPNQTRLLFYYDVLGRCIELTNTIGNTQYRQYNLLGKVTQIVESDGGQRQFVYDSMGNVIQVNSKHYKVNLSYDFFGNVTRRNLGGTELNFVYDKEGRLTKVVNEHSEQYSFELDSEGCVVTEIGFDGLTKKYLRNAAGQVVQIQRANGRVEVLEYNSAGKVETLLHLADNSIDSYSYDSMGKMIKALNQHTEVTFRRDLMGRIVEENCNENWVRYKFNKLGQQTHLKSSLGADMQTGYDEVMSLVQSIEANGWQAKLHHNPEGQLQQRNFPGGISEKFEYDRNGKISRQHVKHSRGIKNQREYFWHGDRLSGIKDSVTGDKLFKHDVHGNLSEVIYGDGSIEFRMPDPVGNLYESHERNDRIYERGGRLLESKTANYKYDKLGNLIWKREKNGKEWNYQWNESGMLTEVLQPDGNNVSFAYDALGRRVWKRFKKTITRFIWCGNKILHEWKEFDTKESTADEIITWVFSTDNFNPIAKIKGDKKYSIIVDHLGTPIQGYNEDGDLIWRREIDSYGNQKMQKGDQGFCNYLYQGQTLDVETGLAYNRFRYYSPKEGMYISQDPIGLAGGNPTLYGYVHDPNSWIDPFGLNCQENRKVAKEQSEPEVRRRLDELYPASDYEILTEPRVYVDDNTGHYAKPDFMVIDRDTGNVVDLVDAKNGGADLTDFQNDLNTHGGTFNGSSRSDVLPKGSDPTKIEPGSLRVERTNY